MCILMLSIEYNEHEIKLQKIILNNNLKVLRI